jgi:hypothetical protein
MPLDRPRQYPAFGVFAAGGEVLYRVGMVYAGYVLLNDGAFVEVGRDVVRRGANNLDAALVRLVDR